MRRLIPFFIVSLLSLFIHSFILFRLPSIEVTKYSHAATLIAEGKLSGERLLDFSPLYLYLNSLLKHLDAPASTLLWMHIVAVAITSGLLFEILKQYFRDPIAIAGTAVFILDRGLLTYTHTFEPEPFVLLFIASSIYLASKRTAMSSLAGGLIFGLGILTRPNFVPVLLAVPFFFKLVCPDSAWKKQTALFLLPALFCLSGLWVRNTHILGYLSTFVMNPGTAFYEGNNPDSWGTSSVYPSVLSQVAQQYTNQPDYNHQLYRDFARKSTGSKLTLPQVNSFWGGKALAYLADHPIRTIKLACIKIFHSFHSYLWHDLSPAFSTEQSLAQKWPLSFPFSFVSALAVLGLIVLASKWKDLLLIYAAFVSQILFMTVIYASSRQRTSILFLFVFFACGALQYLLKSGKRWLPALFVVLLAVSFQIRTDLMREETHLWESIRSSNTLLTEAYRLRQAGKLQDASQKAMQSFVKAPWLTDSRRPANLLLGRADLNPLPHDAEPAEWLDRAVFLLESGSGGDAKSILINLQDLQYSLKRDQYQSSDYHFYLARCALLNHDRSTAVQELTKAIETSPGDPWTLSYLIALTEKENYRSQFSRYFDPIEVSFFLGKAYLHVGDAAKAVDSFQYVTRLLPEFRKAHIYLAAALSDAGRYEEGTNAYRRAIGLGADPVFEEKRILKLFEKLSEQTPTALNHYSYGVVLRQFGHYDKALVQQQLAASLEPSNAEILSERDLLKRVIESLKP